MPGKNKDIYLMELHDEIEHGPGMTIKRVPGGWLYISFTEVGDCNGWNVCSSFVPMNDEFI